jgi:hypothetical protein
MGVIPLRCRSGFSNHTGDSSCALLRRKRRANRACFSASAAAFFLSCRFRTAAEAAARAPRKPALAFLTSSLPFFSKTGPSFDLGSDRDLVRSCILSQSRVRARTVGAAGSLCFRVDQPKSVDPPVLSDAFLNIPPSAAQQSDRLMI